MGMPQGAAGISNKNFIGIKSVAGRDCLVFQAETTRADIEPEKKSDPEWEFCQKIIWNDMIKARGKDQPQATASPPPQSVPETTVSIACIDLETRLPVLLRLPDQVRTYRFLPDPEAALILPPEVAKIEEEVAKYQKQFSQHPLKPY